MQNHKSIKSYKTILQESDSEIVIQKSRFIASCKPVTSEEEATFFIHSVKSKFKAATHYCFAYIIGDNSGIIRYSDDGEPSGTAGVPILSVLQAKGLVNVCVVVTRYFGGILLGAGGLVRAYGSACSTGISASKIITMLPTVEVSIEVPYAGFDKLKYALAHMPVITKTISYAENILLQIFVRENNKEQLILELDKLFNAKIEIVCSEPFIYYWEEEQMS